MKLIPMWLAAVNILKLFQRVKNLSDIIGTAMLVYFFLQIYRYKHKFN